MERRPLSPAQSSVVRCAVEFAEPPRLIHEKIKQPLAKEILFGKLTDGGTVSVNVSEDDIKLNF